eukprot:TRINITY_DN9196_c0_g1_i1.p1 TRINITY_DN9196_c0_g1~~TRINITY_DN9196_c0_g1_i1.p1  ORF type:complete len:124 (-),score=33.26 TRINITY_DN9196_c0_g1_i1:99-470(-)
MKIILVLVACLAVLFAVESARVRLRVWSQANCQGNAAQDASADIDQCITENGQTVKVTQLNATFFGLNLGCNSGCSTCQVSYPLQGDVCFSAGATSFMATSAANIIVPTFAVFFGLLTYFFAL